MERQSKPLKEHLSQLLDPSTSPEKALQLFSYPSFNLDAYTKSHIEPRVIFLAYIRFIKKRCSDACVKGIWEKLLSKTLEYTKHLAENNISISLSSSIHNIYTEVAPEGGAPIINWVSFVLNNQINCPNPYIRLELFRLYKILYQTEGDVFGRMINRSINWNKLCSTFVHTIIEIKPHRLYPSGNTDDLMFSVTDMELFLRKVNCEEQIHMVSLGLFIKSNELFENSTKSSFITHCLQLVGVFATMSKFNTSEIIDCFRILDMIVKFGGTLDNSDDMADVHFNEKQYVVVLQPFRVHIIETLHDLSLSIVNCCEINFSLPLAYLRDIFVWNLGISTHTCDLPRLLLSRQVDGPTVVHQHLLQLQNLSRERRILDKSDFGKDDNWLDTFMWDHMRDYLEYAGSETSDNSGRSSDSYVDSLEESLQSTVTGSSDDNGNLSPSFAASDTSSENNDHSNDEIVLDQ